jgi:hypothetical protein
MVKRLIRFRGAFSVEEAAGWCDFFALFTTICYSKGDATSREHMQHIQQTQEADKSKKDEKE